MPSIASTYVTILPETSRIAPGVKAAFREIGDQKVKVIADVDTAKAKAQLDEATKERKAPVKADADTARAKEQLDAAARDRHSTIHVDVDKDKLGQSLTSAAEEGISKIGPQSAGAAGTAGSQIGASMGAALTPVLLGAGITAIAGIASAFSGLAGLLPAGLLGAGGVVGTLALGLDGVKNAWDAAGKAALSSGKDQTEQAKAVQSAQMGLKTATQDEARAQRDVATARKDATKELRDLNSELRHGALDEKQAELNLQQDIFDLQHGTFQNSIDFQKQQLRVLTDQQDLADAKTRNNDLSQKANTLRQQGVEGNPKVVDAEQRLADSIQKVAVAQQTLTAAFKPSADALAQAQAFAQLSTNAQTLVNTLLGMKPAFQGLKFAVQDALFKDLGPQIKQLATAYMPLLQRVMTSLASTMNQAFGQIAKFLENPQTMAAMQQIFANIGSSFQIWAKALIPFASAFTNIMSVGSQFLPTLAAMAVNVGVAFNNWTKSGQLKQWISTAVGALQQLGGIIGQLLPMFLSLAPIGTASLGAISQLLTGLQPAVVTLVPMFVRLINDGLIPVINLMSKMITDSLPRMKNGFKDLADTFKYVADAFGWAWKVIGPILEKMLDLMNKLVSPLHMISQVGDALTNLFGGHTGGDTGSVQDNLVKQINEARKAKGLPPIPNTPPSLGGDDPSAPTASSLVPSPGGTGSNGIIPIGPPFTGFPGTGPTRHAENRTSLDIGPSGWGAPPKMVWGGPNAASPWGPQAAPASAAASSDIFSPGNTNPALNNPGAVPSSYSGAAYPGDSALLANVPAGHYGRDLGSDLTKGLGDCSSAVADLVNLLDGQPTTGGSMFTGDEAKWLTQRGFLPTNTPMPGTFQVGLNPEHTQATLPGGTNFNWGSESAAKAGGVNGTGAWDPAFTQHFYRPANGATGGPATNPMSAVSAPTGVPGDPLNIVLDPTVPANQRTQQKGGPNGQQLGQDFVSGIAQVFGIDGSVFPDPMSGGLFKGFKGLMSALTSGNKNGGGSYTDRYGTGAAPGGGSGSFSSILQGIIPQAVGDLNPAPGTGGAPGEFMPFQPGSQPGGLLAAPMGNQPAPGGPMVQDNSVTFNGPVGNMPDANQQAINSQVPRFRQGVRPLPVP